jgi:outer membrane protein TolC
VVRREWLAYALVLVVVAVLAAGCRVDQDKEVARYRRVLDENPLPVDPPALQSQPLGLAEAMALANRNNEQLGLSGEDYVQALINKNRAVANFLPTVSFQPSYTIEDRGGSGSSGTGTTNGGSGSSGSFRVVGSTLQRFDAPVVGTLNVFRGFGDVYNLRSAEAVIAQRRELLLDLQATVLLNVAQTYYQILRSERSVEVLRNSVGLQEARLHDVEVQFRSGLATRLTVSQTRAQLAATRVLLTQALTDATNGRTTLAQLVGWHDVANPLADTFAVPAEAGPEGDFESLALAHRQDLLAARRGLEAAQYNVKVAVAQYYPSVDLNLQALLYAESYASASKWSSVLSANLPIFTAGLIEANVRTAWSQLRQAALNESAVRRLAVHDVQTAYENLVSAGRRIADLRDEVQAAEDAYRQSRDAFRIGLSTNLDVLVAQDQMLNAQLQLSSAMFDRTVFYLDLVRATGQLVDIAGTAPSTRPTTGPALDSVLGVTGGVATTRAATARSSPGP